LIVCERERVPQAITAVARQAPSLELMGTQIMPTKFMRAAVLCSLLLALTGCIFSSKPVFDIAKGATDLPVGLFEMRTPINKHIVRLERHGSLYLYVDGQEKEQDKIILSFRAIGDAFYLVTAISPGGPINYGVVHRRSQDKLTLVLLDCADSTPADLVPVPNAKGAERCNAADGERLTAIANRYKADMMANRIEASRLLEYIRLP
jgi:hypothetical protein